MRSEEVALGLDQVGRKPLGPEAVIEGESGRKGRHRDTVGDRSRDHASPSLLGTADNLGEMLIEQKICQLGLSLERPGDIREKGRPDYAATPPQRGDC